MEKGSADDVDRCSKVDDVDPVLMHDRSPTPGSRAIIAGIVAVAAVSLTWTTLLPWFGAPFASSTLDAGQGVLDTSIQSMAVVVILGSAVRMNGRGRIAWLVFAAGAAVGAVGTCLRVIGILSGSGALVEFTELMYAVALALTLVGLVLLPASELRSRRVRFTDTAILVVAATSLVWVLPRHPSLSSQDFQFLQIATAVTLVVAVATLTRCRPDRHGEIVLTTGAISAISIRMLVLPPPASGYPQTARFADVVTCTAFVAIIAAGLRLREPTRRPTRRRSDETRWWVSLPELATIITLLSLAVYAQLAEVTTGAVTLGAAIVTLGFFRLMQLSSEQRDLRRSLQSSADHLHREARSDALTGFGNRLAMDDCLNLFVERSRRAGPTSPASMAVFFVDIDHFKQINDALGHAVGDALLAEVARRLDALSDDPVFRSGGDEFVVIQEGGSIRSSRDLADRIVGAIHSTVEVVGHELTVTVSVGWAMWRVDSDSELNPVSLLQQADLALYEAKSSGRDRHCRFGQDLAERASLKRKVRESIREAVASGELEVALEPVARLRDREIIGMSARLLLQTDDLGTLDSDTIVESARDSGPIIEVLETLLAGVQLALDQADHPHLRTRWISFRLTRAELLHPTAIDTVVDWLESPEVDINRVRIDIAETAIVDAQVAPVLERLIHSGVRLTVDHFGSGPPSLLKLNDYPADLICIDRSFVDGLGTDPSDTLVIRSLAGLATALGLELSADGVTSDHQVDHLVDLGVTTGRGPLFCCGRNTASLCSSGTR